MSKSFASGTKRPLVGFEAFRTDSSADFTSPTYQGEGHDSFVLPFRALLTKRDSITRCKALADLEQAYTTAAGEEDLQTVRDTLPHFAYLYTRILQRDNDRRIRSGTGRVVKLLAELVPKAMSNRFDCLGPDWLLACFDTDGECSTLALQALKLVDAKPLYTSAVFSQLFRFVRQRQPDERVQGGAVKEDESAEDVLERACRVRIQALRAVDFLLKKRVLGDEDDLDGNSAWYKFLLAGEEEGGVYARMASMGILQQVLQQQLGGDAATAAAWWKPAMRIIGEKDARAMPLALACVAQLAAIPGFWTSDVLKKALLPEFYRFLGRMPPHHYAQAYCVPLASFLRLAVEQQHISDEAFQLEVVRPLLAAKNASAAVDCLALFGASVTAGGELQDAVWGAVDLWLEQQASSGADGGDAASYASLERLLAGDGGDDGVVDQVQRRVLSVAKRVQLLCALCRCSSSSSPALFARYFEPLVVQHVRDTESARLFVLAKPLLSSTTIQSFVPACRTLDLAAALCESEGDDAGDVFDALLPRFPLPAFLSRTKHVRCESALLPALLDKCEEEEAVEEAWVCVHLSAEHARARVSKFTQAGKLAFITKFAYSPSAWAALQCYPAAELPEAKLVFAVLQCFHDPAAASLAALDEAQQVELTQWLGQAAAAAAAAVEDDGVAAVDEARARWWSALCAASSPVPFESGAGAVVLQQSGLALAYLDTGAHSVALLQAKLQIDSVEQLFYDVFVAGASGVASPQHRAQRRALQEATELDWFGDFLHLCKPLQQQKAEVVAHVLEEFVPDAWLVKKKRDGGQAAITALCLPEEDFAGVLPVLLQRRRTCLAEKDDDDDDGDEAIAAKLAERVAHALALCGGGGELQDDLAVADDAAAPAAATTPLNVGDVALYTPTGGSGQVSCTVVSRHDDVEDRTAGGCGFYYTIRYWSSQDNFSKEVQTTRSRLDVAGSGSGGAAAELEEQAKRAQLIQIQQLLQQARSQNDRQETIRLMKLAAELEIKPKDSEQAKQEAAERRKQREQDFHQRSKATQQSAAASSSSSTTDLQECTAETEAGLEMLGELQWRGGEQRLFPWTGAERDALVALGRRTVCSRMQIKTSRQVSLVCGFLSLLLQSDNDNQDEDLFAEPFLVRLAQCACECRNAAFPTIYAQLPLLWKESVNNRLLVAFLRRADGEEDAFSLACEPLLTKMRFSGTLVGELHGELFAEMLRTKSLAVFSVLFRFSSSNAGGDKFLDSALAQKFQRQDEDVLTMLLIWLLVLRRIQVIVDTSSSSSTTTTTTTTSVLDVHAWLKTNDLLFHVLDGLSSSLSLDDNLNNNKSSSSFDAEDWPALSHDELCGHALLHTTRTLPTLVREWWCDHVVGRLDRDLVLKYVQQNVTPGLLRGDLQDLARSSTLFDPTEFQLRLSQLSRTVTLVSHKDDCVLEMQISFPDAYPLFPVTVECVKNIGVKPEKWKRWALQIVQLLNKRSGSLLDAIQLWKRNLDKEFEGIEPCPICYSVLHANDSSVPRLTCKTCKNTFHGLCLSTWFTTSHQSLCPLCKQSFLG